MTPKLHMAVRHGKNQRRPPEADLRQLPLLAVNAEDERQLRRRLI